MPTNQSSPWGGAKLRACSNADSPTATTSTHAKTAVASKVPFSQTSLELTRRKDQAKPLCSTPPSVLPVRDNGDGQKPQSQLTAVPHGSPDLPRPLKTLTPVLSAGLKPAASSEASTPPSGPRKERHELNVPQKSLAASRRLTAGDAPLGAEPLTSVCHQDLFIEGRPTLQLANKMPDAAGRSSSPSVPPLCLTLCGHQGAAAGTHADRTKAETRSSTAVRRVQSASSQTQSGCAAFPAADNQLVVRGARPAAAAAELNTQPAAGGRRTSPPTPEPAGPSARARATPQHAFTAVAPGPAGALVGSVTSQISAIQLTRQGQPAATPCPGPAAPCPGPAAPCPDPAAPCPDPAAPCPGPAAPCPGPPAPSPADECVSGQDGVMQVDGAEEELPDELENACSDDDDSDCSSINGTSSTASGALSGVEEPMSLGAEDDREERPALVPSLFPLIPPTLYFSTAKEKVELLPAEQRRLLKWKLSAVTPNIVKHTISRSHFKVTKKSHDWLGCWGHHMKSPGFKALGEHQKLNHFPGTFQIGRKDRLWRNLSKMQVRFGKQEFSFFPRTFVLPQDIKLLRKAWEDGGSRQKWIIKPPASARGIGIQVIHKWSQMPRRRPLLVQKYLHKPYLISGNKFDLRIYVYVSCYDPLRVYVFSDGLVRFASCKYSSSMKTLGNKFMHLTNYSVNKKNSEYQSNSDDKACQGHKWALKALWQYLGSKGVNTTLIWEKIKDIVIKTIIASEPYVNSLLKMHVRTPYSCHELFGFDIMLDEKLKPWILEVNISPSLHSNTALDVSVKGQMISDLLNLAGFRIPQRDDVLASCSSASSSTSSLCGGIREKTKADLTADEKVKRAFYLTQRFADQDFLSSVLDVLTPDDVRVLAESEDELSRLGQFERIFPSPTSSRYLRFFECPRYLNVLLDQWEQKYSSSRSKGLSLLTSLCEKGVHLGTDDPTHMWSKSSYISRCDPNKHEVISPSRARVVVTHQRPRLPEDQEEDSDREAASVSSLPVSPSPGSSSTSSACCSPQPGLGQSASL